MKIASLKVLVDQINNDLGGFCVEFALKRKELGQLRRCSNRNTFTRSDLIRYIQPFITTAKANLTKRSWQGLLEETMNYEQINS